MAQTWRRCRRSALCLGCAVVLGGGLGWIVPAKAFGKAQSVAQLAFDEGFGKEWHDGRAEIAAYALDVTRYGTKRQGNAVAIFVTEPLSKTRRVKIDRMTDAKAADAVEVLKLNLVRDFPTGIYDYNTMLSVFVASQSVPGVQVGRDLKVSFSSQEWCGHVYHQLITNDTSIKSQAHSYFEDEGDEATTLRRPQEGVLADSLFHWARGFAEPVIAPGQSLERPLLNPLAHMRLAHKPAVFSKATLSVAQDVVSLSAAGQQWTVREKRVSSTAGHTYRFWVETSAPFRIVQWEFDGAEGVAEKAVLVGVKRLPYWQQNGPEFVKALKDLGLRERFPLSP
jgi:hypothetical protein